MSIEARLRRERLTVQRMIRMRCKALHRYDQAPLCPTCQQLADYVDLRLGKCPLKDDKPTCLHCPIHCYTPERREEIRQVMRFAGPRMLFHHPILTLFHLLDSRAGKKSKRA